MSLSLGEKLRQAREERGISISEVAEQTRISSLYLDSIENDNYKPLPGGIFNKGFVKSYAKFIGIDEHEALQDYAKIVAATEGAEDGNLQKYKPEVLTDEQASSSSIPTIIFAVIILGLMTGGILFLLNYLQGGSGETVVTSNVTNQNVSADNSTAKDTTPPAPAQNEKIRVEFTAMGEAISLSSTVDGTTNSETVSANTPKVIEGTESVKLSYYKGFAEKVGIKLNGKVIEPPSAPEKGQIIAFVIDRTNLATVWETGRLTDPVTPESAPSPVATPTARATATPQSNTNTNTSASRTATPTPSPRRTPTPSPTRSPAVPTATPARTATPTSSPRNK